LKTTNPQSALRNPKSSCRGQSTLEYLLVGVAVLLAVLFGVRALIQPGVENRMTDAGSTITKAGTELKAAVGF
jgi:hypothetical protein